MGRQGLWAQILKVPVEVCAVLERDHWVTLLGF